MEIVGTKWPLMPEGEYQARLLHHHTHRTFGANKVYLHFQIVTLGPYFETHLIAAYNARELAGKPRKNGGFRLGRRSDLYLMLCRIYESQKLRPDRPTLQPLKRVLLTVSVRTVKKDYRQRPLPACEHYSVVDGIIDIVEGKL